MDAELSALTLSGITLSPQFASSIYTYSADAATTLAETKVMATTNNSNAVAVIKLNGVVDADDTVDLELGENIITVEVTAEDGTTMKTYTVTVTVTVTLDATVSFESEEYYVTEGNEVEVTMVLSHALPGNLPITFELMTTDFNSTPEDYTPLPVSITFGANETRASFTITATQDTEAEPDEQVEIYFPLPTSKDHVIYGDPATTLVTIVGDATPGMTITPRTLDVDEGGTTTYTVKLNGPPTENVTVAITSNDTDVTVSPASLTFMPTDWNAPKTVTVTGVEDSDRDDEIVTLSNDPSGAEYDIVSTVSVAVSVTDNDSPGVNISKQTLTIEEGSTDTYTVELNTQPSGDVTVAISSNNTDVTASASQLTFTTTTWSIEQTVTVTAGQDDDAANDMATLTHNPSGADYGSVSNASLTVTVTDNDSPGVKVSPTSLTIEEGSTDTYTVELNTQPSGDVTVAISSNNTDVTVPSSSSPLTFTTTTWSIEQTVTVTAGQDDDAANDMATLTHNPSGADYGSVSNASLTVTVTDNDSPGVKVSPTSLTIEEGSTDTYTVELNTQPSGDVTVAISSNNTDVTASASQLTFTTTTWSIEQTVTVTAGQDDDAANDMATLTHNPSGADYGSVSNASLTVTVTDNDSPGVKVSPTSLTVEEGSTDTYTVELNTQPSGDVTVAISSNNTDVTASASQLTFTTTTWSIEQTVTVTAGQDDDAANDMATLTHNPSGADYGSVSNASLTVTVTDNDSPGVKVSPTSLTVNEGSTDTYTVELNTQPSGDVTVAISSNNTDVTASASQLTFTTTTWSIEQTVTVTAGQDDDAANDMATLTHNPSGADYGSVSNASVAVTVTDNDSRPPTPGSGGGGGGGSGGGKAVVVVVEVVAAVVVVAEVPTVRLKSRDPRASNTRNTAPSR